MNNNKALIKNILNEYFMSLSKNSLSIDESSSTSVGTGVYNKVLVFGEKKWNNSELGPFTENPSDQTDKEKKQKKLTNIIKKNIVELRKNVGGTHNTEVNSVPFVNEDLAVWFGTKKKPKGSKQPAGPWVNICRKKEGGGHPPCGRAEADPKSYPKCRAKGVAARMSDAQKRAACAKKRKAEKADTQTGKGQKPVYSSYKTTKESVNYLPPITLAKLAGKILYEMKKKGINENLTVIKNLYNRVPFTEKMITELHTSLNKNVLNESETNDLNYLLLGGDKTKQWVNTILYSLKKGS